MAEQQFITSIGPQLDSIVSDRSICQGEKLRGNSQMLAGDILVPFSLLFTTKNRKQNTRTLILQIQNYKSDKSF